MGERRVVLYERVGGSWTVDAELTADGGISICSGDGDGEWYALIESAAVPAVEAALVKRLRIRGNAEKALDVMKLLARAFSRGPLAIRGPFSDITRFLDEHAIPWRSDFWGST
jgi:hypothetical protein